MLPNFCQNQAVDTLLLHMGKHVGRVSFAPNISLAFASVHSLPTLHRLVCSSMSTPDFPKLTDMLAARKVSQIPCSGESLSSIFQPKFPCSNCSDQDHPCTFSNWAAPCKECKIANHARCSFTRYSEWVKFVRSEDHAIMKQQTELPFYF